MPKPFKVDNNTKIVFELDEDIIKVRERLINNNCIIKRDKNI
jgi:hypothetical protein